MFMVSLQLLMDALGVLIYVSKIQKAIWIFLYKVGDELQITWHSKLTGPKGIKASIYNVPHLWSHVHKVIWKAALQKVFQAVFFFININLDYSNWIGISIIKRKSMACHFLK